MALGRKTGGRKLGTPNKLKPPTQKQQVKQRIAQAQAAMLERTEAIAAGMLPLEFLLGVMRDESYPPGARIDAAKAALPFCHAKKADEPGEQVQHITEIRRVIIDPKNDVDPPVHQGEVSRQVVEPGVIRSVIMPAEQERDGLHWGTDEPDAVARARFDKMRRN